MKTLTVEQIMSLRPCAAYPESRVSELWGDRESLSLIEILRLDIPAEDRIWVLTRDGVCDRAVLVAWCTDIADRAVRAHCLTCGVPEVEAWARCWLDGTDRTYAAASAAESARDAAWDAAWAAARAAAGAAESQAATWDAWAVLAAAKGNAMDAAWAARAAAWAAWAVWAAAKGDAMDAARAAARAAAGAAEAAREACAAERRAQVDDLIRALNDAEVKARIKGLAAAGYCDRLAVRRLLADLRGQPGCERIQERSLNNYLAGRSRMPAAVEKGLDALIERGPINEITANPHDGCRDPLCGWVRSYARGRRRHSGRICGRGHKLSRVSDMPGVRMCFLGHRPGAGNGGFSGRGADTVA